MNINQLINKYVRIIKFSIVGIINTAVDFTVFVLLNKIFGIYFLHSQVFGYVAGIINSFILNKIWTFGDKEINKKTTTQFIKFIFINLVSLSITLVGMNIFVNYFNIDVIMSKVMVIFLSQIINYFGYKIVVFNR